MVFTAAAQDWALLNPAYRYNYSNDGTDTIRHQIRVMDVDTLGVDSFRFELNRVAKWCIGCPEECDIRVNLPQFLMRDVIVGSSAWQFSDTTHLILQANAQLGASWPLNPSSGSNATVLALTTETILGIVDSVRIIVSTENDTVKWSKNFGVVLWHMHNEPRFTLIGIQELALGRTIPSLNGFYRYQPGDVVQFSSSSTSNNHSWSSQERMHIEQRIEEEGRLEFIGYSYTRSVGPYNHVSYSHTPNRSWVISAAWSSLRPMRSSPGELVTLGSNGVSSGYPSIICEHGIRDNGHYFIKAQPSSGTNMFYLPAAMPEECVSVNIPIGYPSSYFLDSELGLRVFSVGYGPSYSGQGIVGAVINGDTIGVVRNDQFFNIPVVVIDTGAVAVEAPILNLAPNPAFDRVLFPEEYNDRELLLFDSQGRLVQSIKLGKEPASLDVRTISEGMYYLKAEGLPPQRLVIAR